MGRTNLFEAGRHLGYTEYIKLTKLALYEAYNVSTAKMFDRESFLTILQQIYYDVLAERVTERASAAAPKKSGMWGWIA
jgi:hypothetical protein